jgi:hypothetical protein
MQSSLNIVRMAKSGNEVDGARNAHGRCKKFSEKLKETDHFENLGTDEKIMLRCVKETGQQMVNWDHMTQSPVAGSCEHNETSGFRKSRSIS